MPGVGAHHGANPRCGRVAFRSSASSPSTWYSSSLCYSRTHRQQPPWSFQLVLGVGVELTQRAVELGFTAQVGWSVSRSRQLGVSSATIPSCCRRPTCWRRLRISKKRTQKWKESGNFEIRSTMQLHFRDARPDPEPGRQVCRLTLLASHCGEVRGTTIRNDKSRSLGPF